MSSSSLLLMLLLVRAAGAKKQESVVSPEDHGSRLRGLWKLHMRDSVLRGKGWLKVFAMKHGVVGIKRVKSGLYLWRLSALSHKGELKKGNSVGRHQSCTHFLPRRTAMIKIQVEPRGAMCLVLFAS
ncbi:hypothetical protein GBF38_016838 [Nibea albiflora]|uniref:Uncharacterized protein n=1 Tax=Nibea albiflora TaxID=240163 RepID=A0ACB7EF75_NIBAL|nr:hypothetical protein GBF38_016838 [Nibea albiflora]